MDTKNIIFRSRAPLRISFAGGGTDIDPYPEMFEGAVISSTIDMYSYCSIKLTQKNVITVHSQDYDVTKVIKNNEDLNKNDKLMLVNSILRNLKIKIRGIEMTLFSDTRIGSGLGASSAVTVAILGNLLSIFGINKSPYEISELAYDIERKDCKIKGGYQDQYSATFGGFNFIEFKKDNIVVNPLRLRKDILHEILGNLILCDTKEKRSGKIYEKIIESQSRKAKQNDEQTEGLHKIKKNAYEMKDCLLKGNLNEFALLLHEGWVEKQKLDPNISTNKIEKLYNKAREEGALSGKLLGAGGGGYLLLYCDMGKKNKVIKSLTKMDVNITKFNFEKSGLVTWKIADGTVI